ncbi:hypothetical protein H4R99_001963 [Coemansia sp. RSA 1722]|nr:hypothetical protein H4R99_001963 [Coemansia sp. RSA 1722]
MSPGSTQVAPVTQLSSIRRRQQNMDKSDTMSTQQQQEQQQQQSLLDEHPVTVQNHNHHYYHSHNHGHGLVKDVCCILPSPVQSAVEFVADMAQLLMPSLFMACPNGGCNFTRALLDMASVRNCTARRPLSESSSALGSSTESSPQLSEKQLSDPDMASTASSVEPGDSFGFDHSTKSCVCGCECCQSRCCFTSSTASVRSWRSISWQTRSPASLYYFLNSHASVGSSASQQIVDETIQLATKPPASSSGAVTVQEKSAAHFRLLPPLADEDDALPPSYHNLSVNLGCFASGADEKKSTISGGSAQNNAAPAAVPHHEASAAAAATATATASAVSAAEGPATDADSASCIDQKLVEANRYLMRRVRKLELTNQIIKEAYDEVQEMLLAERQSKTTQFQALERKHQDDMLKLVEEYQKREGESGSFFAFDNDLSYDFESKRASRASTTKSVTAYPDNRNISLSNFDIEFCDTDSLSSSRSGGSPSLLPQGIAGNERKPGSSSTASSAASLRAAAVSPSRESGSSLLQSPSLAPSSITKDVSYTPVGGDEDEDDDEDGISITWARDNSAESDADTDTDSESEIDSCSDSDCESEFSNDSDDSDDNSSDSEDEEEDDEDEDDDFDNDGWGDDISSKAVVSQARYAPHHGVSGCQDSDAESNLDLSFDSEPETDLSNIFDRFNRDSELCENSDMQPSAPHLQHPLSPEDYVGIDPAAAVISRYYANNAGTLDIAADIDDIPTDGYDRDNHGDAIGDRNGESDAQILDSLSPHSIWDAMRDSSSTNVIEDTTKSHEDWEMDLIVQLPADQRIAKFVNRASSHLQQGARGGLSLGFMLHNLEIQAAQFASNHISILCAFIESLYRLAEAIGDVSSGLGSSKDSAGSAPDAAASTPTVVVTATSSTAPPSALAKKLREDQQSRRLAVLRVVKLLHTFIALPDDQSAVLHLLEKLSEANQGTRLGIHAMLLRTLYENELLDSGSINEWYMGLPAEQPADLQHAHLIRKNAMPLLDQLAEDDASATVRMEEIQQQVSGGTNNSTALSTPSHIGSTARTCWPGSLTPVSDENTTLTSQSSDSECTERGDDRAHASDGNINGSVNGNVLSISRKPSALFLGASSSSRISHRLSDPSSPVVDCSRPPKQVTFAAV